MRDINQELSWIEKRNQTAMRMIKKSNYPYVYCPECGLKIINDYGRISQHFREKHIKDRSINADKGHRFHPIPS